MPLSVLFEALATAIEMLRLTTITSLPCFAILLAAKRLNSALSNRFRLSWAKSVFISTYLTTTLLIIVLHLALLYTGLSESPLTTQPVPPALQPTMPETVAAVLLATATILIKGLLFSVLLMPFLFFATYVMEKLKEKNIPTPAKEFIAVFASNLLAWTLLLFAFPFAWGGVLYLLFWG